MGSAKNASECIANTKFILNHIELTFGEGLDIAQAMRNGQELKKQEVYPSVPQVPTIRPERELRATATSPARERWVHSVPQGTVSERHSRVRRKSEKGRREVRKRSRNANLTCLQAGLVFVTLLQYWSKVADPGSQYICSLLFHGVQRGG